MMFHGRSLKWFAAAAVLALAAGVAQAVSIDIDKVPVGNPGNAADTRVMNDGTTGYGSVGYTYQIGKYEVTNAQYTEFLNTVDPNGTNPYSLYNSFMGVPVSPHWGGITFTSGYPIGSKYATISGRGEKPVNFVSFWDACRFTNWLNNGQGSGDTETGAYTLTPSGIANNTVTRNAIWKWAVASENEWYKAAYYKGGGTNAGYWLYQTKSNNPPTAEPPPGTDLVNGSANYNFPVADLTNVGAYIYKPSTSAYGTFDQAGNVWEWNEAIFGVSRGLRGGSFDSGSFELAASWRDKYYATAEEHSFGFRVVGVPEPGTITLLLIGAAGLLAYAWRRRKRAGKVA